MINYKKILIVNLLIFGGALALFSYMTVFPVALLFVMLAGFGMMSQTTITNTLIQTSVSAEMRGRVISYYVMAFAGMQPLGGLFIGTVSHYFGAQNHHVGRRDCSAAHRRLISSFPAERPFEK